MSSLGGAMDLQSMGKAGNEKGEQFRMNCSRFVRDIILP